MSKGKYTDHREFDIPFAGLKTGVHSYEFLLEELFFKKFDLEEFRTSGLSANLELEKKPNMLVANFNIVGEIMENCDRCGDEILLPFTVSGSHIYKYGAENKDDDEISVISENTHIINVAVPLYEACFLAIPSKKLCEDQTEPKGCNEEVLDKLDSLLPGSTEIEETESDPRWEALKSLKTNK